MSLEMITWAMRLDLKGTRFQVMVALANEANSDGVIFTGTDKLLWYSNVSLRTFRTIIAEFRAEDLLHTERRYKDFGDGRECDTLVLHPWNKELFKPNYPGAAAARQVAKRSREKFEITTEEYGRKHTPTTDSTPSQPECAKLAPSKEVPSQTESAKLAPKERYMQKQAPLSAKMSKVPLIGTRARLTLNNPVIDQSITQSANTSTGAREETPVTDGLMTDSKDLQGDICGVPAKIFITQLRTGLSRYNAMNTSQFAATELLQVVEEILNRTDRTKVTNPVGFCVRVIGNEPGGIPAILELIESKSRYQHNLAIEEHARRLEEQEAKTTLTCPRCDIQYPATGECNSCAADRKALQTPEPPTETIYGPDGKPLRGLDLIHAMRKAQNPSALNRQPRT